MTLKEFINQKILTNRKGLFFLGARPYMGKTSFAVGIACEIAKDYPVAYVTLEMSKEEWIKRAKHYQYITDEKDVSKIDIFDEQGLNATEIIQKCNKEYRLVIIDYLQLIDREDGNVKDVQKVLKELAESINYPILVLSQLSGEIDERESHIPQIEDLQLTQLKEEFFDEIFILYRGVHYDKSAPKDLLQLITKKQILDFCWIEDRLAIL